LPEDLKKVSTIFLATETMPSQSKNHDDSNEAHHESEPPSPRRPRTSRDGRRLSKSQTINSLEDALETQLLKLLVRKSEQSSNTIIGLLRQMVKSTGTQSALPQPTLLDLDPRSRRLIPTPGL
jgi:hypothetical protein